MDVFAFLLSSDHEIRWSHYGGPYGRHVYFEIVQETSIGAEIFWICEDLAILVFAHAEYEASREPRTKKGEVDLSNLSDG